MTMRIGLMSAAVWVVVAVSAQAQAQDESLSQTSFSHKGQVTINIHGGMGYRALFPYDEEFCGDLDDDGSNSPNCLARSPFAANFALGYGIFDKLEVFFEAKIGLEKDFSPSGSNADGPRLFEISPGVRAYIYEQDNTRFFSTAQLAIDRTEYDDNAESGDLGVRNINAFQLDLHKTFGIYLYFGEIVSWKRWLRFEVEAGVGVQARFP